MSSDVSPTQQMSDLTSMVALLLNTVDQITDELSTAKKIITEQNTAIQELSRQVLQLNQTQNEHANVIRSFSKRLADAECLGFNTAFTVRAQSEFMSLQGEFKSAFEKADLSKELLAEVEKKRIKELENLSQLQQRYVAMSEEALSTSLTYDHSTPSLTYHPSTTSLERPSSTPSSSSTDYDYETKNPPANETEVQDSVTTRSDNNETSSSAYNEEYEEFLLNYTKENNNDFLTALVAQESIQTHQDHLKESKDNKENDLD